MWSTVHVYTQWAISHRTPTLYAPKINGHPRQYYHGHHVVQTLPHRTIPCSVLSREEGLPVATPPMKSCAELWKTPFASLLHKYSGKCHREHGGASACLSIIKVHERIHWPRNQAVRDLQRIMTDYDCTVLGVRWLLAYKGVQLKSKLQTHWNPIGCKTSPPRSLGYGPAVFFHHLRLTALASPHGKNRRAFQNFVSLLFFFFKIA